MADIYKYLLILTVVSCKGVLGALPTFSAPNPDEDIKVPEGAAGGTVYTVVASDNPNTITDSILSQTPANDPALYVIDGTSGVLSTAVEIDFEALNDTERTTTVIVQATSSAAATDTATISFTVTAEDVNDNIPVFEDSPFCRAIPSTALAGTNVGTFTATDADITAAHNTISAYAITAGDDTPPKFMIGVTTGLITTTGVAINISVAAEYELVISASDGTNTGYGNVTVKLDGTCVNQQDGGNGANTNILVASSIIIFVVRLVCQIL